VTGACPPPGFAGSPPNAHFVRWGEKCFLPQERSDVGGGGPEGRRGLLGRFAVKTHVLDSALDGADDLAQILGNPLVGEAEDGEPLLDEVVGAHRFVTKLM